MPKNFFSTAKVTLSALAMEALAGFISHSPKFLRLKVQRFVGWIYAISANTQKKAQEKNLTTIFGISGAHLDNMVTETFKNFGFNLIAG